MKIAFFGLKEQEKKEYFLNTFSADEIIFFDQNLDEESIPQDTSAEIISVFVQSKVTQKVIDAFSNLKLIAIRATGFDNIDIQYAKEKNIKVCNVPSYGSHTVAEFTFGLILSLSRKIPQATEKVRADVEFNNEGLKGFDLYGKTLGVIGTGKIGTNVIKIAKGFGMNILATDEYPNEQLSRTLEFHYVPLMQLLQESDVVTIHVPATEKTHHLININNIFQMKKGGILINTARGDIVETEGLYEAISQNHLAGAGLDVLEGEDNLDDDLAKEEFEPLEIKNMLENSRLIKHPNVIVTPHTAFYTQEAERAILQTTLENIQAFIKGSSMNEINQ